MFLNGWVSGDKMFLYGLVFEDQMLLKGLDKPKIFHEEKFF